MHFDYSGWKPSPPRGIRGGNSNYLLGSLFYDQTWQEDLAVYVMGAEAYQTPNGKWLPSAYQILLHSSDEYDAMIKLVGNLEQWDRLKDLEWFSKWLERGLREQEARVTSKIRQAMLAKALDGDSASARTVLAIDKEKSKKPVGRPVGKANADTKDKVPQPDAGDAGRLLSFKK